MEDERVSTEMAIHATPEEEQELRVRIREREDASCPRCRSLLRQTSVPPRRDVAYVRNRVMLECDGCGMKAILDR